MNLNLYVPYIYYLCLKIVVDYISYINNNIPTPPSCNSTQSKTSAVSAQHNWIASAVWCYYNKCIDMANKDNQFQSTKVCDLLLNVINFCFKSNQTHRSETMWYQTSKLIINELHKQHCYVFKILLQTYVNRICNLM